MRERLLRELHSRFRDEFLNDEVFSTLREARILIERCRRHYNIVRPHSSLRYRPPMPESVLPTCRPCTNNQIRPFGAHARPQLRIPSPRPHLPSRYGKGATGPLGFALCLFQAAL
ncbi:integrase core domain-containing protein [Paracoccus sp. Ld10]|uniref:integrase core domain-containing protein n=1 Tax=Paracoccus sp. Ld10 TaxID=649158 RepID=UPI003867F8A3